ncbi:MAG: HU family DNA-binding protein [Deltaproteobacteria bacterium]|nr:HU family DNA-binding protein [Deltaproteobacteria bacterium]
MIFGILKRKITTDETNGAFLGLKNKREGRNTATSRYDVKPKKLPFFKPGKELRERVNG